MYRKKVIIIAEAGVNHDGNLQKAKKLIKVAKDAGADFIKFQSFNSNKLVMKKALRTKYQIKNTKKDFNKYQLEMLKKLELGHKSFIRLNSYAKKNKIKFLLSPFDLESVDFIKNQRLNYIKIPSGEITNLPLLKKIAKHGFKVILSTGMCNIKDIKNAVEILLRFGIKKKDLHVLQCNTEYPTPYKDVNLNVLLTFQKLGYNIGFSDHTMGDHISIAAVAMGARIIEKHITLDKQSYGPDHIASMSPIEFKTFVKKIREVELSFGDLKKYPTQSEKKNINKIRKSIYASDYIKKGDFFTENNLCCKRPFVKISPMKINNFYGKKAKKDYKIDEIIE